jgi:hypothetical protein
MIGGRSTTTSNLKHLANDIVSFVSTNGFSTQSLEFVEGKLEALLTLIGLLAPEEPTVELPKPTRQRNLKKKES